MTGTREALRVAKQLGKLSPDESVSRAIEKVQRLLTVMPMAVVLEQVRPGEPVAAKAKAVGVSRQTFYYWLQGVTRPNKKQAQKLAKLTGYAVDEIRGHVVS
jgi:transcriptional regulator with XRE-family HTH domain